VAKAAKPGGDISGVTVLDFLSQCPVGLTDDTQRHLVEAYRRPQQATAGLRRENAIVFLDSQVDQALIGLQDGYNAGPTLLH
jgi:hypothetical protein